MHYELESLGNNLQASRGAGSSTAQSTCRLIPYPFLYASLGLGVHKHQVTYLTKGVWYEATGIGDGLLAVGSFRGLHILLQGSY